MLSYNGEKRVTHFSRRFAAMSILATLLSSTSASADQQAAADSQVRHKLRITWHDRHQLLQRGFKGITRELDTIFGPLGVDIDWNRDASVVMEGHQTGILVLLLPEKPQGWPLGNKVMGAVSHSSTPVIRIFFADVARTLSYDAAPILPGTSGEQTFHMTRAMARVLAHEIIHAIAPPHPHADAGLMSRQLTRDYLRNDTVSVDPGCTNVFLASLRNPHRRAEN